MPLRLLSLSQAFLPLVPLPYTPVDRPPSHRCYHLPIICKKPRSNSKKPRKSSRSKPTSTPSGGPSSSPPPSTPPSTTPPSPQLSNASAVSGSDTSIPIPTEARLKLPDRPATSIKRKRKPRASDVANDPPSTESESTSKPLLSSEKIKQLTAAYRRGGAEASALLEELDKDPDYLVQTGNPSGEYDLASAIIGTGRPNDQGVYVLPYLQSGHLLLLMVILVCTFVYYPGFPLTELGDEVREGLKRGLALTYLVNGGFAVRAFGEAKRRGQPAAFWAGKTAVLGYLALRELLVNAPIEEGRN